jgi:hypothetical protein
MKFGFGHIAESDERLLPGVSLENPKAAGGEHPQWVCWSRSPVWSSFCIFSGHVAE